MTEKTDVCIIGAGIAGLSCAFHLEQLGYAPLILERRQQPGGRIGSDLHEGFILDRGFQVLLSSYFELKKIISLGDLDGRAFDSAVNILFDGRWHNFQNPLRHPLSALSLRKTPFIGFSDLVKLGKLYLKAAFRSRNPYFHQTSGPIVPYLKQRQLSDEFINHFIKPFFGGVFLDPTLEVNADIFLWMLHLFTEGKALLPKKGMQQLPKLMAGALVKSQIRYGCSVAAVEGQRVFLEEGAGEIVADKIVIATDSDSARQLIPSLPQVPTQRAVTLYFAAVKEEFRKVPAPALYLNGSAEGPLYSVACLSAVQPSYAPHDRHLFSCTVLDPHWQQRDAAERRLEVVEQLAGWFGVPENTLHFLREYQIDHALPSQSSPPPLQWNYAVDRQPDIYLCGEYVDHASINGAAASGRKVASAVVEGIKRLKQLS